MSFRVSCGTPSKKTVWKAVAIPMILLNYIRILFNSIHIDGYIYRYPVDVVSCELGYALQKHRVEGSGDSDEVLRPEGTAAELVEAEARDGRVGGSTFHLSCIGIGIGIGMHG